MTTNMVDKVYVKKLSPLMNHAVNKTEEFNRKCCVREKDNTPDLFF